MELKKVNFFYLWLNFMIFFIYSPLNKKELLANFKILGCHPVKLNQEEIFGLMAKYRSNQSQSFFLMLLNSEQALSSIFTDDYQHMNRLLDSVRPKSCYSLPVEKIISTNAKDQSPAIMKYKTKYLNEFKYILRCDKFREEALGHIIKYYYIKYHDNKTVRKFLKDIKPLISTKVNLANIRVTKVTQGDIDKQYDELLDFFAEEIDNYKVYLMVAEIKRNIVKNKIDLKRRSLVASKRLKIYGISKKDYALAKKMFSYTETNVDKIACNNIRAYNAKNSNNSLRYKKGFSLKEILGSK